MKPFALARIAAAIAVLALSTGVHAQAQKAAKSEFKPQVGQAGKDVIWVPTPDEVVDRMLTLTKLGPNDFHMDLGSGDGRTVIAAAKKGARSLGIEYNPDMIALAQKAARDAGVSARAEFRKADIFATDFSRATVITLYLLPELNLRLRPTILAMKPGTRVASHQFNMAEWESDQTDLIDGRSVHYWMVPAKADGHWTVQQPGGVLDITFQQSFQKLAGSAKSGGRNVEVKGAKLAGDAISFAVVGDDGKPREYSGRVSGKSMEGTIKPGDAKWSAALH